MTYDLRREPWIPWRRRSRLVEWGPPALLVDRIDGAGADPVVGLATPRPDFAGALQEFLIGLLSAALQPADDEAWKPLWIAPPTTGELQEALDRLPPAFDLDGDGPRFFQDLSEADFAGVGVAPVEQLLIDTPGEQTTKLNKDLFVKRGRVECLGRPAAAMALLTLQTYAPAGGQGHRTSLRGGGPLTTLVDPQAGDGSGLAAEDQPLWRKLWANVETGEQRALRTVRSGSTSIEDAFPWLRATRTSNEKAGGGPTHAARAHPLEAYFGLPRRIRLEFGDAGRCDLTGELDGVTVTGFRMRNYGAQYAGWKHPLSPHYRQKLTEPWLPIHGQPGGIGWRDWVGLTMGDPNGGIREPAAVVAAFHRRAGARAKARLHVFGYDMDNMKARGWTEAIVPLFAVAGAARQTLLRATAAQLADATGTAASALLYAVKAALFQNPKEAPGDLGHVRGELWDATEAGFYRIMAAVSSLELDEERASEEADGQRAAFVGALQDHALAVFDRWCPTPSLAPEPMRRRVVARHDLVSALTGYSKLGEQIFTALGVPLPGGGRSGRAARKRTRTEADK
jgi:CRISPR system Cascade subunit CasA